MDFPIAVGTNVYASFKGIVVRRSYHKGMGNVVAIRNGNIVALYAHLSDANVSLGDIVEQRALIGISGETGDACITPHLHFEIRDISKDSLKNMVFEPTFDIELPNYKSTFSYKVNNRNTVKNLRSLALLYFGEEGYWKIIKNVNGLNMSKTDILLDNSLILIPNF